MPMTLISRFWQSFSAIGLLAGTLFFAASLTPSLLPRTFVTQGVLSGASLAAGYGIGVFGLWLWNYMQLPKARESFQQNIRLVASLVCALVAIIFLWQTADWENSIREIMELNPVDTAHPMRVGAIALVVFAVLIVLARLFQFTFRFVSARLDHVVPIRISRVISITIAILLFWSVAEGLFFRLALRMADAAFKTLDELADVEINQPSDQLKTGSSASLVDWESLGRTGRKFISTGPELGDIETFTGRTAVEPIRVYVGLRSAESAESRAELALAELKRVGGFDRSVLVIATPTGTGWMDPAAMDTLEYLHRGDVASVAVQYSYLTSWLSLLVEPGRGAEIAEALFDAVYGHWTTLPSDDRPKLYLFGISLGVFNSERSTDLFEILADPIQGALWSGPPFPSRIWRSVTSDRTPDSPAWLPRFRDGSVIRFTSQKNALDISEAEWGPLRIVYLQYASDPIVFFDPQSFYREPDWMKVPRGPDVSPTFLWFPIVTGLQLTVDMAVATTTPIGYGHLYAPGHYIDAWLEVTAPVGWNPESIERLKALFEGRQ